MLFEESVSRKLSILQICEESAKNLTLFQI